MKSENLFLKPDEAKFIGIAVLSMLEQLEDASKNQKLNWNPPARKDLKDMITAGSSLRIKLRNMGLDMRPLDETIDGDIDRFFTKPS